MAIVGGRITELKVQKRNQRRVNVHIDGCFAFGLAAIEAMRLKVGQQLSAEEIAQLKARDQAEAAYDRALNFLSYRPRSVAEVRRRLSENAFGASTIDDVIARLSRAALLDDEAFVQYWIENRDTHKPRSVRAMRYELRQKGVSASVIDNHLSDYDEADAAYRAASTQTQRLVRTRKYDVDTLSTKLLAFLNRRGFSYSTARDAVDRILSELGAEQTETS